MVDNGSTADRIVPTQSLERARQGLLRHQHKRLAHLALARGWVDSDQIRQVDEELNLRQNEASRLNLGDLLIAKGWLNLAQFRELWSQINQWDAPALPSSLETTVVDVAGEHAVPSEVQDAARDASNVFDRYIRVAHLGHGSVGTVWKCYDRKLGRFVAVKFLEAVGESTVQRFLREAAIAAKLDHPNIARIYEVGNWKGTPFIAMQYIPGKTLDDQIYPAREAGQLMVTICRAIHYAHEQGIIHRDIKPGNIMLTEQGELYVLDFSLAKELESATSLSLTGAVMGTPPYMSPEQARGEVHRIDARSDVFSLGGTLYTLLTGQVPFPGDQLVDVLHKVQQNEPIRPRVLCPDVPAELETILSHAMDKVSLRRYQSAQEFAEDVERYLRGEPIRARRSSFLYRLRKVASKHRRVAFATSAAFVIAMAFAIYVFGGLMAREQQKALWIKEGRDHEQAGRWDKAQVAYERAFTLDSKDSWLRQKKEEMAERVKAQREELQRQARVATQKEEATRTFKEAERDLHMFRIRSYREDWRLTDSEITSYHAVIGRCREQMAKTGEAADGWWVIGRAFHVLGNWGEAERAYEAGLKVDPSHANCLLHKARLAIERAVVDRFVGLRRKRIDAEERLKEALSLLLRVPSGQVGEIEFDLAQGYGRVVQERGATEYCNGMLTKWEGKDFCEEFVLIRGLAELPHLIEDATQALKRRPGSFEAYCWRGMGKQMGRDLKGAVEDYTSAIRLNPCFALAFLQRGVCRHDLHDVTGAIEDYTQTITLNPQDSLAYYNRGNARSDVNELADAIEDYTRAIQLDARYSEAYSNRGNARYRLRDLKGAIEDQTRAIDVDPGGAMAYYNRGVVRAEQGDFQGAVDDYSKAIEMNPRLADAYCLRGTARENLGEKDPSRVQEYLEAAVVDYEDALKKGGASWEYRSSTQSALGRVRTKLQRLKGEH